MPLRQGCSLRTAFFFALLARRLTNHQAGGWMETIKDNINNNL
jgi:hypothetical protein